MNSVLKTLKTLGLDDFEDKETRSASITSSSSDDDFNEIEKQLNQNHANPEFSVFRSLSLMRDLTQKRRLKLKRALHQQLGSHQFAQPVFQLVFQLVGSAQPVGYRSRLPRFSHLYLKSKIGLMDKFERKNYRQLG